MCTLLEQIVFLHMSDPCILQTPFHSTEIYRYRCACIIQKRNWGWFWGHCVLFPAVVLIKSSISVWKGVCLKSALHWSTLTHATAHAHCFYTVLTLFKQYFCNSADCPCKKVCLGQVINIYSNQSIQNITECITPILGPHWKCLSETKLNCKLYHCITIIYEYTIMYHSAFNGY